VIFTETGLAGAWVVEPERLVDHRGFFARTWCQREFEARGLASRWVQCSISFSEKAGTLRGMHLQAPPHQEAKLIRCTRGAIHDVIIDLRADSPTFLRHFAIVLTAENHKMLYVPEGFAHGFLTIEDQAEVFYQMTAFYSAAAAQGVRWDDPAFGIRWPLPVQVISERDRSFPDFAR
jgi:dTDP-4-dehydrorhamnose 3,5-epimerase